ncbi:hypothetical protein [Parasphingorhabdus cellanae]|nr:hypothetical protein [Parasphingorhabdus cellanae]
MTRQFFVMFRLRFLAVLVPLFLLAMPAQAQVAVTFYSHDFGKNFPHAFFVLKGKLENGETVDSSFGFTAVNVSPGILWGSVKGKVETPKAKYIANSNPHFTVTVGDSKYRELMALVAKWRNMPQKSYSLNKRNCVHFASEAVAILGYRFNLKTKFWKKPRSFMEEVMALNPGLKK